MQQPQPWALGHQALRGKGGPPWSLTPISHLRFTTERGHISLVLSHKVGGNLLWRPQETNTLITVCECMFVSTKDRRQPAYRTDF